MKRQRDYEARQKKKSFGPGAQVSDPNSPLHGQVMRPIDFLKNTEFRRGVQPAFKSCTRDQVDKATACKTKPPDVAKYTPKYHHLDADDRSAQILNEHQHLGQ